MEIQNYSSYKVCPNIEGFTCLWIEDSLNTMTQYMCFVFHFQDDIGVAVKELLALKAEYKKVTGQDWKPGAAPPAAAPVGASPLAAAPPASTGSDLDVKITAQGNKVRELKANKASKVSNASTDIPYIPVFFF